MHAPRHASPLPPPHLFQAPVVPTMPPTPPESNSSSGPVGRKGEAAMMPHLQQQQQYQQQQYQNQQYQNQQYQPHQNQHRQQPHHHHHQHHTHHSARPHTPPKSPPATLPPAPPVMTLPPPPPRPRRRKHDNLSLERSSAGAADQITKKRPATVKAASVRSHSVKAIAPVPGRAGGLKTVDSTIERIFRVLDKPGANRAALGIFNQSLKLFAKGMPGVAARVSGRQSTNLDIGKLAGLAGDFRSALYITSIPGIYKKLKGEFGPKGRGGPDRDRDRVGRRIGQAAPVAELGYVLSNMLAHVAAKDAFYRHSDTVKRAARNGKLWRINGSLHVVTLLVGLCKMFREAMLDRRRERTLADDRRHGDPSLDGDALRAARADMAARRKKRHEQYMISGFYLPAALGRAMKVSPWPEYYNWIFRLLAQVVKMHVCWRDTKWE